MRPLNQTTISAEPVEELGFSHEYELSIVMPCLNEAETIETCVVKALGWIERSGVSAEVVIADNGSTDGSQEIAERLGARVVHVSEKGYGSALMGGIQSAKGKYIIMGDADDSYDFSDLSEFVQKLREGHHLVMGNRFKGGIMPGAMPPLHRYLGNPVLTGIGRLFFKSPSGDFHCGLRGFSRLAIQRLDLRTTGMEFASEMVVKSTLHGLRITEVPTVLSPDGRSRPPHLRSWRDGWRHLRFLLLYCPKWLFFYPGLAFMVAGLAVGAWILPAPRHLGSVELDVHTLLYAALAVLLGFQGVVFALFTKAFAISERLLPHDAKLEKFFKQATLEKGLLTGAAMIVLGIGLSIFAVGSWGSRSFGPLNPSDTFRLVIPAAVSLAMGFQVVLSSFFLSVLGLKRKD